MTYPGPQWGMNHQKCTILWILGTLSAGGCGGHWYNFQPNPRVINQISASHEFTDPIFVTILKPNKCSKHQVLRSNTLYMRIYGIHRIPRRDLRCAKASCELRCAVASYDVRVQTHFFCWNLRYVCVLCIFRLAMCDCNFASFSAIM